MEMKKMIESSILSLLFGLVIHCIPANSNGLAEVTVKTSEGPFKIRLFSSNAPKVTEYFSELLSGKIKCKNALKATPEKKTYYGEHRVTRIIPNLLIQFERSEDCPDLIKIPSFNENNKNMMFDRPFLVGLLGSQSTPSNYDFFITLAPAPWLNKYIALGELVEGIDVIKKIAKTEVTVNDEPKKEIRIIDK